MSATSIPTLPTLRESRAIQADRLWRWSNWFTRSEVLIRVVLYLTTLIYLRSVLFDYVYDDSLLITLNPWMESWKQVPELLTHSFWGFLDIPRAIDFYRPLVSLVFALIRHLLGPAPGWFHLVAAGLHVWATYLVYRLACEVDGRPRLAAIAAGLFGLHPTKVETAAWISGISDSLSVVFFLASMIWYFKSRNERSHSTQYKFLSAWLLLLALFSKEAAVFAPVLIAIYEFSATESRVRARCVSSLKAAWPFLAVTALAMAARGTLIHNHLDQGLRQIPLQATSLTAPQAILWYFGKQLWPSALSVQYPIMLVRTFSLTQFLFPLTVLLAGTVLVVWMVRGKPTGIFFGSWLVLMLAPVILYFIRLQEHDRYFYLPSVATSLGAAYLLERIRAFDVRMQAAVVISIFAVMTGLTINYESYWDNDTKLFTRAVQIAPDNPNAAEFLADTYVIFGQHEKAEAFAHSVIERSHGAEGWYILGTVLLSENKNHEAREALQTAQRLWGRPHLLTSLRLANADLNLGEPEEAIAIYRGEINRFPDKAFLHGYLATALKAARKPEEAKRESEIQKQLQ